MRSGWQFVDMLAAMVAVIDSPPRLHEKLEDLGPMHIRKGVKADYMPRVGGKWRVAGCMLWKGCC